MWYNIHKQILKMKKTPCFNENFLFPKFRLFKVITTRFGHLHLK